MCSNSNIPCNCGCKKNSLLGFDIASLFKPKAVPYHGLGLTASGKRNIKSGAQYDQYFNLSQLKGTETTITNGDQKKTLQVMRDWVQKHKHQTAKIAQRLKGGHLVNTLSNLFDFLYNHVQYTLDVDGREQLRTPLRTWADRARGVDCDCYSIFISSVLHNLGIPHAFRMTKYSADWQHVYVVVPKDGKQSSLRNRNNYFVVDPVTDRFNYEVPFKDKHDLFMEITGLAGLGAEAKCPPKEPVYRPTYVDVASLERQGLVATEKYLENEPVAMEKIIDQNNKPSLAVTSLSTGIKLSVPTVISEAEAEALKATLTSNPEAAQTTASIGKNGWIWAALGVAGGLWLLSSNKPHPTKKESKNLSGTPKRRAKRKTRKRKTITL